MVINVADKEAIKAMTKELNRLQDWLNHAMSNSPDILDVIERANYLRLALGETIPD